MSIEINNVAVRDLRAQSRNDVAVEGARPSVADRQAPSGGAELALTQKTLVERSEDSGNHDRAAGLDAEKLAELADDTSSKFQALGRELQFEVAEMSGRTVITVMDRESGDIIRSIPPEKLIQVSDYLREVRQPASSSELSGVLLSDDVVA